MLLQRIAHRAVFRGGRRRCGLCRADQQSVAAGPAAGARGLAADFAGGGAQEVLHASGLSRRARRERAADSGPGDDRLGRRRAHVGGRDARLHARHQREGGARAHRQDRRARRHQPRRPHGQAHGVSGRPRPGALAEGARSRRARRRAAEPLAVPGHQRRPARRSQRARHERVRAQGRERRAQREQPAVGARQQHLHIRGRHRPPLEERQVRRAQDAVARAVGHHAGRCGADFQEFERIGAARRPGARRTTTCGIRTCFARAAATSR